MSGNRRLKVRELKRCMIRLRKKKSKLKKKKVAIKNNSRNNWRRTSKLTIKSKLTIRDKKNYLKKKLEN